VYDAQEKDRRNQGELVLRGAASHQDSIPHGLTKFAGLMVPRINSGLVFGC